MGKVKAMKTAEDEAFEELERAEMWRKRQIEERMAEAEKQKPVATSIEAMKQALEALEKSEPKKRKGDDDYCEIGWMEHNESITSLRQAIAEVEGGHMTERLIEKIDRLANEAGIKEVTPEIRRFAMLVRQDVVAQWPQRELVEKNSK